MKMKKILAMIIFGILILLWLICYFNKANNVNNVKQFQTVKSKNLIVEKHTKTFKFNSEFISESKKFSKVKILKFYVLDEFGNEYQINQKSFNNILLNKDSIFKDSIIFTEVQEIFEIKK